MHYTINYSEKTDREAVLDWVQWLGFRRTRILIACIHNSMNFENFESWCSFAGVQGKPVEAAWKWFQKKEV